MSIIYDALKKVQISFTNATVEKRKIDVILWVSIGFVFIGFLGCGFAFMLLINSSRQRTTVKYVAPIAQVSEKRQVLNLPLISSKPDTSQLALNGIIAMEGEYLALINNQILKEGDYIQGMRIISITKDKVELYSKGKLIVLNQK